jgi:Protein of unknown function (DUF1580).
MASKQIYDSPQILSETLLDLTEATKKFPIRCSRSSLERWVRQGVRGTQLETVLLGNRRYTSLQAIDRFVRNQLHVVLEQEVSKQRLLSQKEIKEKSRLYDLPEPLHHVSQN